MNYTKAILELFPDIKFDQFELMDLGKGIFISRWDYPAPKPDLKLLEDRAIKLEAIQKVYNKRIVEYPPLGDQLDAILKYLELQSNLPSDINNIVIKWRDVKTRNPLPQ